VSALGNIDHIVVLMLENRSFDCILGKLYPPSPQFDGLTGTESNLDPTTNQPVRVWNSPGTDPDTMSIPDPDPGELWADINTQLFGNPNGPPAATPAAVPAMGGFARNYVALNPGQPARNVMHYFSPEQVPVISQLARQFAVCDRWFASAPCQTWPNRFFAHTGTAAGYENNSPPRFPYLMDTIYNRLESVGRSWAIYFHDIAQSKTLTKLWTLADHFHFYDEFRLQAAAGTLPAYSFIEPRYFTEWSMPNDQHPPHVVTLGEQLIADVYNSLRNGKAWAKTLLVITYDEHGGCYDHVPPPAAVPPGPVATVPFGFDRYGVRVPAVLVSPYIRQGTVLRPPAGSYPFDHTSILATLRTRFPEIGPALTVRDHWAPHFGDVLALPTPDNVGPDWIDALPYAPTPALIAHAQERPLNSMQKGLVQLAANLPGGPAGAAPIPLAQHVAGIQINGPTAAPPASTANVRDAAAYVKQRLGEFFRQAGP
jgi:phospholipase C